MLNDRLKEARQKAKLTQKQAAEIVGIATTTLSGYERGASNPDVNTLGKLMTAYRTDANFLFQDYHKAQTEPRFTFREINHIKKYRALDAHGKEMVDLVLNKEAERMTTIEELAVPADLSAFRLSEQSAAAGLGTYLGPESFRTIMVKRDALPRKASFGVPVTGDSMEPKYHDGDILIISTEQPMCGEVGIYTMDGQGYVKVLGDGELISLNPAYDPLPMTEDIICNGKVIGVLDHDAIVEC